MKKAILGMVVFVIFATTGMAQTKMSGYIGGGLGVPMSPSGFTDEHNMGPNFMGGLGFELSPSLELVCRVGYNMFPINEDAIMTELEAELGPLPGVSIDGGTFKVLAFGADLKVNFQSSGDEANMAPFIVLGLGMASTSFSDVTVSLGGMGITVPVDASETNFALNFGAGFNYMFSPSTGLFVDGRYCIILTEDESVSYLPIRAGLKFNFGG
ncbi:MAG: outer membrane beta-barrel protein [candidate division Zixibacteria bacterium]